MSGAVVLPEGMRLPVKPPRVKPFPNETAFAKAAQARVREQWGGLPYKVHGSAAAVGGIPDLLICLGGRFVAVELKQPGNRPTSRQMARLRAYEAVGAVAGWARTETELDGLLWRVLDPVGSWSNPQLVRVEVVVADALR